MKNLLCIALLSAAIVTPTHAGLLHRSAASSNVNQSRVTLNVLVPAFANLAKGMGFTVLPTNCASPPCADANGFPNQTPTANINTNPSLPAGYYGTYTWSWSGAGAMQDTNAPPTIYTSISPQGTIFEAGNVSSADLGPGNHTIIGQALTQVSNPTIVFEYGWLIQSIDSNAGVIRINTKTNFVNSTCWGATGTADNGQVGHLVNIVGANANTGANGTWAIANCTASTFDLLGSTFSNAQAGVGGTGIFAGQNLSYKLFTFGAGTVYSGFTNLIIAKTPDIAVINAGHYWDTTYVTQLKQLMNPNGTCVANRSCGFLRFMDFSAVQGNYEQDFSQRIPPTGITYAVPGAPAPWYPNGYYAGTITNTADAYTASDPSVSVWNGSTYIDGAIVQGAVSATNSTVAPTLNIAAHGAKPVLFYGQGAPPAMIFYSGPPASAGLTVQLTFDSTWIRAANAGSPYVFSYVTTASGHFGNDLASTAIFQANLDFAIGQDAFLTSVKINHGNTASPYTFILAPTAQAGRLALTYTAGPAIITIGTIPTSTVGTGMRTFKYNYLLDAWIWINSVNGNDIAFSAPIEVAIDLANQVGANVWWCFGTNSVSQIQSVTQTFGNPSTGLSAGLRFGMEAFNETWNSFAFPYSVVQTLAGTLGLSNTGFLGNASYTGLRTKQYADISKTAWTGQGRAAADFSVFSEWQVQQGVGGVFDVSFLQGTSIGTANTYVATYGAVGGGTVATNYAASPNRPVDVTTFIGQAPYWGSSWFSGGTSGNFGNNGITGTLVQNAPWLQAQLDFANGNPTLAYTELTNTFNGTTLRGASGSGSFVLGTQAGAAGGGYHTFWVAQEAIAAQYDASRPGGMPKVGIGLYEGAPQWSFNSNGANGTNSLSDSLAPLTTTLTSLAWNTSAYVLSGLPAAYGELAQQTINATQAWKNDATYKNLIKTFYYQDLQTVSGANREVHAAQFGYNASIWALFPTDYHLNNPYQNYNAIQEWNAGN